MDFIKLIPNICSGLPFEKGDFIIYFNEICNLFVNNKGKVIAEVGMVKHSEVL